MDERVVPGAINMGGILPQLKAKNKRLLRFVTFVTARNS
jgi:hypothetical protein